MWRRRAALFAGLLLAATAGAQSINGIPNQTVTIALIGTVISGQITASTTANFVPSAGALNLSTTESPREMALPRNGIISHFTACITGAQSATGSLVYTYRLGTLNGTMANTSLVVTVAASAPVGCYSDTTHSFAYVAGQAIDVQITNNATANAAVTANIYAEFN